MGDSDGGGAKNATFLHHCILKTPLIYQDRLGTDISRERALKKEMRFSFLGAGRGGGARVEDERGTWVLH